MAELDRNRKTPKRYIQRPTPIAFVEGVRFTADYNSVRLSTSYALVNPLPEIEIIQAAGAIPLHGVYHGPGGDIIVNVGDYVTITPDTGEVGINTWYGFESNYEGG